jgi:hypothetical protein
MYDDDCRLNILFYYCYAYDIKYNSIRGCGYWARFADADNTLFISAGVYPQGPPYRGPPTGDTIEETHREYP